jgi:hypothetical protein
MPKRHLADGDSDHAAFVTLRTAKSTGFALGLSELVAKLGRAEPTDGSARIAHSAKEEHAIRARYYDTIARAIGREERLEAMRRVAHASCRLTI